MFLFGLGIGLGAIIGAIVIYVVCGALFGYVAGRIMGAENEGFAMNAFLGIVGSVIGGFIGNALHIHSTILGIILSIVGSCIVVGLVRKINRS